MTGGGRDWASTELERNDGEYSSDRLVSIVEEAEKRGANPGLLSESCMGKVKMG